MLLDIARNARYARNARKKFSSKVYISRWRDLLKSGADERVLLKEWGQGEGIT